MTDSRVEGWTQDDLQWQRKLGRLRLHAEPLSVQLHRYRRVTWTLTILPGILGLVFLTLFSLFQAPLIGLALVGILFLPVVLGAWLEDLRLHRLVAAYEREHPSDAPR